MILDRLMGWLLASTGVAAIVMGLMLWNAETRLDTCRKAKAELAGEYAAFRNEVQRQGVAAAKAAKDQAAKDKANKEQTDAKTKHNLDKLRADNRRLRDNARSRGSILPPAGAAGSPSPDRACINRAEFERAYQQLAEELRGLGEEGDGARLKLDAAKQWAQGRN